MKLAPLLLHYFWNGDYFPLLQMFIASYFFASLLMLLLKNGIQLFFKDMEKELVIKRVKPLGRFIKFLSDI